MTLADLTLAYDFLRQKEQRYSEAVRLWNQWGEPDPQKPNYYRDMTYAKGEVDRAFALFVQDLTSYIRES